MSKFIRKFSEQIFIRNTELPICSKCKYFIEHSNNYPYDPVPSNEQYGKCKRFGEVNFITGELMYDLARECRTNSSKCGNTGKKYIEKNQYWICEKV